MSSWGSVDLLPDIGLLIINLNVLADHNQGTFTKLATRARFDAFTGMLHGLPEKCRHPLGQEGPSERDGDTNLHAGTPLEPV